MPQRPLITFEYVIQNFDADQDELINNEATAHLPSIAGGGVNEINNNISREQQNNGLHQIKIFRSSSNVGDNRLLSKPAVTNHAGQICSYNRPPKTLSTTEIWHHGPR